MSQWVVAGLVSASGVATFFANQSGSASPEAANAAIDAAGHSIG